jgi:hypothetical protein
VRRFLRFAVAIVAAFGVVMSVSNAACAEEVKAPVAAWDKDAGPVYTAERPLPGARVESVLTDPRGALTSKKRGTSWLLHYGTGRDNCARADASPGLRMMCVSLDPLGTQ